MRASEIRDRFLRYFERNGHSPRPSSSLVPADDPTLLFTNAGMVQFKRIFLGLEDTTYGRRAVTAQKCVRAGGKHNDLEQVGHTYRHHTFFEMLGNFSFGDYFKRDAIRFAWEWVTEDLKLPKEHLRVTVFREDDEARALWREVTGLSDSRIYGLGEKDNFWQMADTGPCGPCSEIYVDLAFLAKDWTFPADASGEWTETDRKEFSTEAFVEGAEAGRFLEIWNLVFMQFDRQPDGTLVPLPKPSVDTGAGLERIAAALQGVTSNYHTDLFLPLLKRAEEVVGLPYTGISPEGLGGAKARSTGAAVEPASFRVLADHARAVAFLLADGVFPSNEGRGYVLRRILRRAVRHAWLLGRRAPTLVSLVEEVVAQMSDVYPELAQRKQHILETTRAEEERFLTTIDGGMARFDQLAPALGSTQGSTHLRGSISGEDAFRLYDTYGFPIDLTELMARERGYSVDIAGFEAALAQQRSQSQAERKSRKLGVGVDELADVTGWRSATPSETTEPGLPATQFVGYDTVEIDTLVTAVRHLEDDRVAVLLRETPFYAESGGQVSDRGVIVGQGWRVDVNEVRKIDGRTAAIGKLTGEITFGPASARVPSDRRKDTERNHTATHLLHAELRHVLGEHVHQAGSVVEPDRLRFDFTHHGPLKPEQLAEIERRVNRGIWAAVPVVLDQKAYKDAVAGGAMALFGEKYGDVVRVVTIPGLSVELCGGTHVRNTSEIGLFKIVSETGVAAGVRRIVALTGPRAFELMSDRERALAHIADRVKVTLPAGPGSDAVAQRVDALLQEKRQLEKRLDEAMRGGGGDAVERLVSTATPIDGMRLVASVVSVPDVKSLQALGDAVRERLKTGVAALGATFDDGRSTLLAVVTDDARDRGVRADAVIKELAAAAGGRGGGKPHMAQAGVPDAARIPEALGRLPEIVRGLLGAA
ncbi:MAG TPA: alanine--tRNA ligase [Gemmatimonadaceae bacterium]|nr:alanine--tRNA ligase [Gemmatimonadaceae bacterium]